MVALVIDTSVGVAVAVVGAGDLTVSARVPEDRKHAELLAPLIHEVLARAGAVPADVTRVVVGTGPAPFTGLRAGIVAARTFAFARGVPVLGVSSLDAVALQAVERGYVADSQEVVVLADARRREVYWARYRAEGSIVTLVSGPGVDQPGELLARGELSGATVVTAGEIAALEAALAPGAGSVHVAATDVLPEPALLARLATARGSQGIDQPTEPLYLRRPDASVPGTSKRVSA